MPFLSFPFPIPPLLIFSAPNESIEWKSSASLINETLCLETTLFLEKWHHGLLLKFFLGLRYFSRERLPYLALVLMTDRTAV